MKKLTAILAAAAVLTAAAGCTPRRTDSPPTPDGDTVEVVIPEKNTDITIQITENQPTPL